MRLSRPGTLLATGVRLFADAVAAMADALAAAVRAWDHLVPAVGMLAPTRLDEARSFAETAGITKHEVPLLGHLT
jgi:hypothetical protein